MSCFICGSSNCTASFHSLDEQKAFERAEEAYDRYLEIRSECQREWKEGLNDNDTFSDSETEGMAGEADSNG